MTVAAIVPWNLAAVVEAKHSSAPAQRSRRGLDWRFGGIILVSQATKPKLSRPCKGDNDLHEGRDDLERSTSFAD